MRQPKEFLDPPLCTGGEGWDLIHSCHQYFLGLCLQSSRSYLLQLLSDEGDDSEIELTSVDWISAEEFYSVASQTRSVCPFTKVAYPELHGSKPVPTDEPLYERKFGVQR
mgnify:CR=1 FL=1